MDEEMNNLKVLGIATGIIEYKDESVDEYNYLLVEDVKNKAKYYINMHSIEEMTDFEDLKDTILEIEPYRKEKELTHLPKGEVFIEGFSINPKTLEYKYTLPKEEDIFDSPEYREMYDKVYDDAKEEFEHNHIYPSYLEIDEDYEDEKTSYISRATERLDENILEYYSEVYIKNNVFSCKLGSSKSSVKITEGLFEKIPEASKNIRRIKAKLHQPDNGDPLEEKAPGLTSYNKNILNKRFEEKMKENEGKRPGKTQYNKLVYKYLKNKKLEQK